MACTGAADHAWLTATITITGSVALSSRCYVSGLDDAGTVAWAHAELRDPASIGQTPSGGIFLEPGRMSRITWQVDRPAASSYRVSCLVDRSAGS